MTAADGMVVGVCTCEFSAGDIKLFPGGDRVPIGILELKSRKR